MTHLLRLLDNWQHRRTCRRHGHSPSRGELLVGRRHCNRCGRNY